MYDRHLNFKRFIKSFGTVSILSKLILSYKSGEEIQTVREFLENVTECYFLHGFP